MIYEDEYAESSVDNGDFDIAIPFRLTLAEGGEPEITVFPSLRRAAEEFTERFGSDPSRIFSKEAVNWTRERVRPYLTERLFELCPSCGDHFINYRLGDIDRGLILPETRLITGESGLENLTGYDFDAMAQFGHICYGTVVKDRIVSAACTNYPFDLSDPDEPEVEIGVETHEDWRGRGYAASNCAALASALLGHGVGVLYECESENTPSVKLIERLGGREFARNFCIVGNRVPTIF